MDSGKKTINHVEIRKILPVQDGYRMPGEYEPHRGWYSDLAGTAGILEKRSQRSKKSIRRSDPGQ